MKKEDIIKSCMGMSITHLLGLLKLRHDEVLKIELEIVDDWIKNERCECCKNPLVKNKKISLNCEHLNKIIDEKIKDKEFIISLMSKCLNFRTLMKSEKFRKMISSFTIKEKK